MELALPWRMHRWWRRADPGFSERELLYMRFVDKGHSEGQVAPADYAAFLFAENSRFPNQSVMRQRYARPLDVLLPHDRGAGVMAFPVSCLPQRLEAKAPKAKDLGALFSFCPFHVPIWANYAHSEVGVLRIKRSRDSHGDIQEQAPERLGNNAKIAATAEARATAQIGESVTIIHPSSPSKAVPLLSLSHWLPQTDVLGD